MKRGELWWADLPEPVGSEPGYRRPVLIISDDSFNQSKIRTVLAVSLTSNLKLRRAPGNLFLTAQETGLSRDSVLNVSQIVTLDKEFLESRIGRLAENVLENVESGLKLVLGLA